MSKNYFQQILEKKYTLYYNYKIIIYFHVLCECATSIIKKNNVYTWPWMVIYYRIQYICSLTNLFKWQRSKTSWLKSISSVITNLRGCDWCRIKKKLIVNLVLLRCNYFILFRIIRSFQRTIIWFSLLSYSW